MSDAAPPADTVSGFDEGRLPRLPRLTGWQIVNMNVGFFGIQYSFGLQQGNMSPIYKFLGADEASLPYLWLAGPVTGLLVQPIVGAMSDKTTSKLGRRTPYFLIGAVLASLGLLFMPFSPALWVAASLLWILDAANNITMEPYRAFVSDKLNAEQRSAGFLMQSAFTGLGQTLAYMTPSILVSMGMNKDALTSHNIPHITVAAFVIGAIFSITSVLWTVRTTKEAPLTFEERARIEAMPRGLIHSIREVGEAIRDMPKTMWQLSLVMLFQWYAIFAYWQYIVLSLSMTFFGTTAETSVGFRDAGLINGRLGGFYNFIAFVGAIGMVPFTRRFGPKLVHAASLCLAGAAMLSIPSIRHEAWLLLPAVGIGIAWASMMGNPYIMLSDCIPTERTGVYMGIFNMFIVIPMVIQILTLPLFYKSWLFGNPEEVVRLAGALMIAGSIATLFIRQASSTDKIGTTSRSSAKAT
jgi:maltose/moltooligosaccharide transporter